MNLDKKFLGQVLTPKVLADFMAGWLIQNNPKSVLDPAGGDGALILPFKKLNTNIETTVVEIDKEMADACKKKLKAFTNLEIINNDFFRIVKNHKKKYDAIIVNPPYVKGQFISKKEIFFETFKDDFGLSLRQNSNLYCYFIIALTALLNPGGRASILVPIELFNANFGEDIKNYLIDKKYLKSVVFIDNKCNVFENAVTTSAVLFLEAPIDESPYEITIHNVKNLTQLKDLSKTYTIKKKPEELLKIKKWSSLKENTKIVDDENSIALRDFITTKRGIATGANEFFHMTEREAKYLNLRPESLKLCVANINGIKSLDINQKFIDELLAMSYKTQLFDVMEPNEAEQDYLDKGIKAGLLNRYILANKKVWYQQEKREPAHILFNVFAREKFNFLLNSAKVLNLTNNHCIYVKNNNWKFARELWKLLNSEEIQPIINAHKREYGNGLYKMEPKDLLDLRIDKELWNKYISSACVEKKKK